MIALIIFLYLAGASAYLRVRWCTLATTVSRDHSDVVVRDFGGEPMRINTTPKALILGLALSLVWPVSVLVLVCQYPIKADITWSRPPLGWNSRP